MSAKESKVTARIDAEKYQQIKNSFHHGQQTQFFRQVFDSLCIIIAENNFHEVTEYLYGNKPLVLPAKREV